MLQLFKRNKMFRVFLTYQFFSGIGGVMFSMFILLSVHLIYQNPVYTGIAGFLMAAPSILSFAVGPVVDRRNKITIMRITTFLEFVVLSLLAFTPLREYLGVLFMFAVIFTYNIAALFENPAGTALLPQIVLKDEIMEANSLIEIIAMTGGIIIGAVLLVSLGGDINFSFLYGFSAAFLVLAFIVSWFLKNTKSETAEKQPSANYVQDLKEGAGFIRRNILLLILIAVVTMDFVGEIAYVNRPMFLEYHAGAQGYVLFTLMVLIGGIIGSYFMGVLGKKFKVGSLVFILLVLAGVSRIAFALIVPIQIMGGLIATIVFAALLEAVDIIFSTLNQKIPPKNMVGRVDTISTTCISVFVALGAFLGGFLGNAVSDIGYIFIYQGIGIIVVGVIMILMPSSRRLSKVDDIGK